jgi:hypothetical protein
MATFFSKLFRKKKLHHENTSGKSLKANTPATGKNLEDLDPNVAADLKTLVSAVHALPAGTSKDKALTNIKSLPHAIAFIHGTSPESFPRLAEIINNCLNEDTANNIRNLTQDERMSLIPWIKNDSIIEQFLADITNEDELATLATEGKSSKVRQLAASRVISELALKKIQKETKGKDKKVFQITKDKLSILRKELEEKARTSAQVEQLALQIQQHARTEANKLYEAKLNALSSQWDNLLEHASKDQVELIAASFIEAKAKARAFNLEQQEAERAAAKKSESETERLATLAVLEQTIASLKANDQFIASEIQSVDAVIKTQENRWLEATRQADVTKQEQKQYQASMHTLKHWQLAATKAANLPEPVSAILSQDTSTERQKITASEVTLLNSFLQEVDWPDGFVVPLALNNIKTLLGEHHTAKAQVSSNIKKAKAEVEALAKSLESALEEKQLKKSQQLFKDLSKKLKELPHAEADRFKALSQLLGAQVSDLRDWQGFATTPKQIELCERMEALGQAHLDPQAKADKIKALQDEWKALGGSSDQELWQRFKVASDAAFEVCRVFFDEQKQLKSTNLEKRRQICQELAHFVNNNDWQSADWKATEKIGKAAKEEWKNTFPVDFKANKKVQAEFNACLDKLDRLLDSEREKNEAMKKAIVQQAQLLVDSGDTHSAINKAKELQKQWSAVGITRYGEDRKLWKKFREACDTIFGQREQEKQQQQAQQHELIAQAEDICKRAEALPINDAETQSSLNKLNMELVELPMGNREIAPFKERLQSCLKANRSAQAAAKISTFRTLWTDLVSQSCSGSVKSIADFTTSDDAQKILQSAIRAEDNNSSLQELCILMEIVTGAESPAEDQAVRMQIQVNRLSAGIRQENSENDAFETFERALAQWVCKAVADPDAARKYVTRVSSCLQQCKPQL